MRLLPIGDYSSNQERWFVAMEYVYICTSSENEIILYKHFIENDTIYLQATNEDDTDKSFSIEIATSEDVFYLGDRKTKYEYKDRRKTEKRAKKTAKKVAKESLKQKRP